MFILFFSGVSCFGEQANVRAINNKTDRVAIRVIGVFFGSLLQLNWAPSVGCLRTR